MSTLKMAGIILDIVTIAFSLFTIGYIIRSRKER